MLNESRIKLMTRTAILEQNGAKDLDPYLRYRRQDYIGLCMLAHLILGTAVFGAVCVGMAAYLVYNYVINVDMELFSTAGIGMLMAYSIYIITYLLIVYLRSSRRYDKGAALARTLRKHYSALDRFYTM